MVVTALRAGVAETGAAACFVRGVVLVVALGGGPTADGAGTGGVADLGQVPQLHAGIVAASSASLRAPARASTRSHAHTTPISSASDTPAKPPSSPAAASAATARPAQPGSTSKTIPGPNPAAGLDDSPGKTRADPGWPGPRARSWPLLQRAAHRPPPRGSRLAPPR